MRYVIAILVIQYIHTGTSLERTVQTNVGSIKGRSRDVSIDGNNKQIYEYLGIPFAEPPTGARRFVKPVPKANFTEPFEAFSYGLPCTQYSSTGYYLTFKVPRETSEDCLTLNIHTPNTGGSDKYAVMVFIHGGGYAVGTSSTYEGHILAAYGDVVVVTVNYRLGVFGFLSTEDEHVRGNAGLWDQHFAIKWVRENIEYFGGDVTRITIFGESAGGGSVQMQMLHTGNEGLFQRAIAQSGTYNTLWIVNTPNFAYNQAKQLAVKLNCSLPTSAASQEIASCLRNITNATELAMYAENLTFMPGTDGEFFTQEGRNTIKWPTEGTKPLQYQKYDLLTGTNGYDGHYFLVTMFKALTDMMKVVSPAITRSMFRTFIQNIISNPASDPKALSAILDAAMFTYTNAENPNDVNFNLKQVNDFLTDYFFFIGSHKDVHIHSYMNNVTKTYQYEFNHAFPYMPPGNEWLMGATHAFELMYLFGFPMSMNDFVNFTAEQAASEWSASKASMDYWTNFAKTGDPNQPRSVSAQWKPFTHETKDYLYFPMTGDARTGNYLNARRAELWMDYIPKLKKSMSAMNPKPAPCEPTSGSNMLTGSITMCFFVLTYYLLSIY